ncbi:MAG: exodeoxyribonuclease VII small subunit [Bacteroidetes bacterium]|jgi:exodeoxyribonuclease VII small subunit|nr:exodeoxyribonuclease VII small subunit [Bacteroidota bacterium]MDA0980467.1 exodeoxyribonuclease VII small subunit [Bacteroidota bacterium]
MSNSNKTKPLKDMNYDDSITELQKILSSLQNDELSIDELTDTIKRSTELLELCNSKLRSTEEEVNLVIQKLGLGD